MAELTFRSAGVGAREIDLTGPANATPTGIPAGIIGTANQGPAFVPVTIGNNKDFVAKFGESDGEKFGPLAVFEWLEYANSATYLRVLGAGDGTKRTSSGNNTGKVTSAGFVVGSNQVQDSGVVGRNPYAVDLGVPGRVHFLGCFMSESAGSDIFSSAGLLPNSASVAYPILRGVTLAASGVVLTLSGCVSASSNAPDNVTPAGGIGMGVQGYVTGAVDLSSGQQNFVLLLNGHINTAQYPNVITASFDMAAPNYFSNILNTDPLLIENAGYCLYTNYDIHPALATVTGSGVIPAVINTYGGTAEPVAFITTASLARNVGSADIPNFESFEDRYRTPMSPFVVSQQFGGSPVNLFRVHTLSDGQYSNNQIKISIRNVAKSTSETDLYGAFDLLVRQFDDTDDDPVILEQFLKLSLNPGSERYIAKIIGDQYWYWNFDKNADSQKLVQEGSFPNLSNLIRVEVDQSVIDAEVDEEALPVGFRGPYHLVTSGSGIMMPISDPFAITAGQEEAFQGIVEPPVPMRLNITRGVDPRLTANRNLYWGVQFEKQVSLSEPNSSLILNDTIVSLTKYFPKFHTTWQNPWVGNNEGAPDSGATILDADRFNNNLFSLENIQVRTGSNGLVDSKEWTSASYVRQGNIVADETAKTRGLSVATDFGDLSVKAYTKFSFFIQGGFDGVNIFDIEKSNLTNAAVKLEMDDPIQGQDDGPTVMSYKRALDIVAQTSEVDIKILAIPGIRHEIVTDKAVDTVETRFDAMYVMDIEERDSVDTVVTSSAVQAISVTNTVAAFTARNLDSNFAAAYFPDVVVTDPFTQTNVQVPPSVTVLGALALNDKVAYPWFAPAGFSRGLTSATRTALTLGRNNLDVLYDARINPIVAFPGQDGPVVWGQKTLQAAQSSLDRVNVRRLLIEIRRDVKSLANRIIFEPNRDSTLARFEALVRPRLQRIQELQGVERFLVKIDTTTTTQADVENNTVRGIIYLQPTRTAEFVSLDFVITNAGAVI
jgi:hypothetical protein